jgi:hypothetical protein
MRASQLYAYYNSQPPPNASLASSTPCPQTDSKISFRRITGRGGRITTAAQLRELFAEWRHRFSAVARHACLTDLTYTIDTQHIDDSILDECRDVRLLDLLEPLLPIASIESLLLTALADMPLSDGDVFKIASAWPWLEYIDLHFSRETEKPSFLSLQHLAALCPRLTNLAISLDTGKEVPVLDAPLVLAHPLEELILGIPDADDALVIVRHLKSLFPNLNSISSYSTDEGSVLMELFRSDTA